MKGELIICEENWVAPIQKFDCSLPGGHAMFEISQDFIGTNPPHPGAFRLTNRPVSVLQTL